MNFNQGLNKEISQVELDLETLDKGQEEGNLISETTKKLHSLYRMKVDYLKHKSRQSWIWAGDTNLRFFHQVVEARNAVNHIGKIEWEGKLVENPERVKFVVFQHFKSFFSKGDGKLPLFFGKAHIK